MSGFSFSDLEDLGSMAVDSINSMIAPGFRGDINRVNSGDAITEHADHHNSFVLGPGSHGGFLLEKPFSDLWGVPGVLIDRLATFKSAATVRGIHFRQGEDISNKDHLALLESSARVMFSNCVFERNYQAASIRDAPLPAAPVTRLCFVLVESGGYAVFSNCTFLSTDKNGAMTGVGTVVQNLAAAPGRVFVGTGANFTTQTHGTTVASLGGEIV